jgi:kynurenine formamidase
MSSDLEWSNIGGLVGRGVLLDYVAYAARHNIKYNVPERFTISVDDLEGMIKEQNVELKIGDILLIRSGYVKWHDNATQEEREEGCKVPQFGGVESTPEAREWIWNHHFAAVGGDSPSWEAMPPKGDFFLVCPTSMTFSECSTIFCWPCGEHQLERCLIVKSWPSCVKKTNVGLSFSRQRR